MTSGADDGVRHALEGGVLEPCEEERVALEFLDLAVGAARSDPSLPELQVLVTAGLRVMLEEETFMNDAPVHDVVGAAAEGLEGGLVGNLAESGPAVGAVVGDGVGDHRARAARTRSRKSASMPSCVRPTALLFAMRSSSEITRTATPSSTASTA